MKTIILCLTAMLLGLSLQAQTADSISASTHDDQLVIPDPSLLNITDSLVIDSTDIAHPQWETVKRPKHYLLAGAEVVGTNLLFHVLTRYVANEDYARISGESIKNNFKKGFYWDNDKFETNLYSHPYQGSLYYNCARTNGLNFWESAPYALFGSSIWEMFMETQPPSTNDIIATPLGGIALGEISYRLSSAVLNNQATGGNRVVRELVAAALNPVRGVRRLISGEMWHKGPQYVDELAQVPIHFQFGLGYLYQRLDQRANNHMMTASLALVYNNPFTITGKVPFEFFVMQTTINQGKHSPALGAVNVRGIIWGKNWDNKSGSECLVGIFQNFNYFNTETVNDAGEVVPFRIAETVSYGPGIIYRAPTHRPNSVFVGSVNISGIALGGSMSNHYNFQERDYDLGSGYSLHTDLMWVLSRRVSIRGNFKHFHLFTVRGYENRDWEHIDPNYLNAMGATGNTWMHMAHLGCTVALHRGLGVTLDGMFAQRRSHYKYFDDIRTKSWGLRLMLSYQL